jgi:hypothetical protein
MEAMGELHVQATKAVEDQLAERFEIAVQRPGVAELWVVRGQERARTDHEER